MSLMMMIMMMRSLVTRVRLCNTLTMITITDIITIMISLLIRIMSWCHLSHEIRGGGDTADKSLTDAQMIGQIKL